MKTFLIAYLSVAHEKDGSDAYRTRALLLTADNADEARGKAYERFEEKNFATLMIDVKEITEIEGWVPDDGRGERPNRTDLRAKANEVARGIMPPTTFDGVSDAIYAALVWGAGWL